MNKLYLILFLMSVLLLTILPTFTFASVIVGKQSTEDRKNVMEYLCQQDKDLCEERQWMEGFDDE